MWDKWKEKYDPYDELSIVSDDIYSESDYISAMNQEIINMWIKSYNPLATKVGFKHGIYDSKEEYFNDLRRAWDCGDGPFYDFRNIDPADFESTYKYLKEIEKRFIEENTYNYLFENKAINLDECEYGYIHSDDYCEGWKDVKDIYDPFDEYDGIDPVAFKMCDEYKKALKERRIWKDNYDPYNIWDEINPSYYDSELAYSNAIKDRVFLKEKCDLAYEYLAIDNSDFVSFDNFLVSFRANTTLIKKGERKRLRFVEKPVNCYSSTLDDFRKKWQEKCDPDHIYWSVLADYFDTFYEYEKVLNEKKSWKDKYDCNNQFPVDINYFYSEEEYLEYLREKWRESCDLNYDYWSVLVEDFDSFSEYECAVNEKKSWIEQYNCDNEFDVDVNDFYSEEDYLDALREKWEEKCDPNCLCWKVSVYDYNSLSEYKKAVDEVIDTVGSWKNIYDSKNQFDIDPSGFNDLDDYLDALREKWEEKYNPGCTYWDVSVYDFNSLSEYKKAINEAIDAIDSWQEIYNCKNGFDVTSQDYFDLDFYLKSIRNRWQERCDPDNYYWSVSVEDFDSFSEYANAVNEKKSWKKLDCYNRFDVDVNNYDYECDYLDAIRKNKNEEYYLDEDNGYLDDFDISDSSSLSDCEEVKAVQEMAEKNFSISSMDRKPRGLLTIFSDKKILIEFKGIYKKSNSNWFIDLKIYNQNVFPIGVSLCDVTVNKQKIKLENNDLVIPSGLSAISSKKKCFELNPCYLRYKENTRIRSLQFNLDIDRLILSRDDFIDEKITLKM